jgi:hypothetical protein
MKSSSRTFLAAVVTVLASVAILATLLAHYAGALANSSSFSSRAVTVVQTGPVESLIANTVTGRVLDEVGNQPGVQPIVADAVRQALSNGKITAEIRSAAQSLQSQLASGQANSLTLTLPDVGAAVAPTIESRSPQLAEAVSRIGTITVVDVRIPPSAAGAIHDLTVLGRDSSLLVVFSVALIALALIISPDRRRTLLGLGLGAVVSGLLAAAVYLIGRGLVLNQFSAPTARTAARAAWSVYLGGLETSGLVLAAVGIAVALTAGVLGRGRSRRRPSFATAR